MSDRKEVFHHIPPRLLLARQRYYCLFVYIPARVGNILLLLLCRRMSREKSRNVILPFKYFYFAPKERLPPKGLQVAHSGFPSPGQGGQL